LIQEITSPSNSKKTSIGKADQKFRCVDSGNLTRTAVPGLQEPNFRGAVNLRHGVQQERIRFNSALTLCRLMVQVNFSFGVGISFVANDLKAKTLEGVYIKAPGTMAF
jgi:hypothetical protein